MTAICVTGMGAVTGLGWDARALWEGLLRGQSLAAPIRLFDPERHRTGIAIEVPAVASRALRRGRDISRADLFGLHAAEEAVAQARLAGGPLGARAGVFFGSSTGGLLESEDFYEEFAGDGAVGLHRIASQQANGPGDAVARAFGVQGPVETVSSACVSASMAVAAAVDALRAGEIDLAIVGGADGLCQITFSGFNCLRAVDPKPSRPFRADRAGLSMGEGAGVVVLEREESARTRVVPVLARVEGVGLSCDAFHMSAPRGDGSGLAEAMRAALRDAGRQPADIAFVNAHGTGTQQNDKAEWGALDAVFGESASAVPITSTKGAVGHLLGAAGTLELVVTAQCLRHRTVHATPGDGEIDPALPVALVREPTPLADDAIALSSNLAFGGANTALVVGPGDPL